VAVKPPSRRRAVPTAPPTLELGRRAEALVLAWLVEQGYEIVATNLRLGALEIDVVARKGPVVAVVEVRTRGKTARTTAFGSVSRTKQMRLRRAGERLWQRRYRHDASVERLRFDVAAVRLDLDPPTIEYVVAAF
jgi:putative endonuclease